MTEVRTTSSTGGQKGVKPERFSLMPRAGLAWISRVFGFGAEKYDAHNWRRGYEWSKSFDALERHFQAAKDGETYDEESGLPHLAHAGFHILVLLTWLDEQGEGADNPFDDRWPAAMERMRRAKDAEIEETRESWVDVGKLTESIHLTLTGVSPDAMRIMFGDPVLPTEKTREEAAQESEALLDALEFQGVRPESPSRGLVYGGEIPVEDLRI